MNLLRSDITTPEADQREAQSECFEGGDAEMSPRPTKGRPKRIREITGQKFEKASKKAHDFSIACDELGRIAVNIIDPDPIKTGNLVPEEINAIFVQSILQDLSAVYNFVPENVVITQSDRAKEIDSVLMYGVFKLANTPVDRIVKDCEAAVCAYGLPVLDKNYIILYFGEADSWATLIENGRITSHVRNGICGLLIDTMNRQLKGRELTEKSKKISHTLGEMLPILSKQCNNAVDGIVLAGSDIGRPLVQMMLAPWRSRFLVYDSIPTDKVIVVGATVISAKRFHDRIESNPLNGVIKEMAKLTRSLSLYNRDSTEVFQPPPTYDSIVNVNTSRDRAPTGTPPIELSSPRERMASPSPTWQSPGTNLEPHNDADDDLIALEVTRL